MEEIERRRSEKNREQARALALIDDVNADNFYYCIQL